MDGELTLIVGAIAILSSIVTYFVNHLLSIREKKLIREFDVREKGRDFFHQTYGIVATLSDMVKTVVLEKNSDKAMILTEKGYIEMPKKEVIKTYKESYEKYSKCWYDSREKGLEIFLTRDLVDVLRNFWGYAGYFYENDDWDKNSGLGIKFVVISRQFCDEMDKLLGLCEKKSRIPKWLNPKKWLRI